MKQTPDITQEIACQQVLVEDNSVFSVQWSVIPRPLADGLTPGLLMERYLGYIRSRTLGLIRPCHAPDGMQFRLLSSQLSLISFLPPVQEGDGMVLRICGGLLVQPRQCDRGELHFEVRQQDDGARVALQLSDFCPLLLGSPTPSLLRLWLYRLTQAAIHRLVTVRFLAMLYRDLAGRAAPVRVVTAQVRNGRPV